MIRDFEKWFDMSGGIDILCYQRTYLPQLILQAKSRSEKEMLTLKSPDPRPASILWGSQNVVIYNEAYVPVLGHRHPSKMGVPFDQVWKEFAPEFTEMFRQIRADGKAIKVEEGAFIIQRSDFKEETYYDITLMPLYEGDCIQGFMNPVIERTKGYIAERRLSTLLALGESMAKAKDLKAIWKEVLRGLRSNEQDIPFALLYSVIDPIDNDTNPASSESSVSRYCSLEGVLGGVPEGHAATPQLIELHKGDSHNGDEIWTRSFWEAASKRDIVILSADDGSLPTRLLDGIQWRGCGDPSMKVVVLPIRPTQAESVLAFLVLGLNSQRPYDDDYQVFLRLLNRQLATSVASVVLIEDEIRRAKLAADQALLDSIKLEEQLALQAQEAAKSQARFQRLADTGGVSALWVTNSEGIVKFANKAYYDITGLSVDSNATAWIDSILEEDLPVFQEVWKKLMSDRNPVTFEIRLKRRWKSCDSSSSDNEELREGPMWILASAYTDVAEDGSIEGGKSSCRVTESILGSKPQI